MPRYGKIEAFKNAHNKEKDADIAPLRPRDESLFIAPEVAEDNPDVVIPTLDNFKKAADNIAKRKVTLGDIAKSVKGFRVRPKAIVKGKTKAAFINEGKV